MMYSPDINTSHLKLNKAEFYEPWLFNSVWSVSSNSLEVDGTTTKGVPTINPVTEDQQCK